MNNRYSFLIALMLFASQLCLAQEVNVQIIEGFKNGDSDQIGPFLTGNVDYIGPNIEEVLTADQTKEELNSFFSSVQILNYITKHNGSSPSGNSYSIGVLTTNKGAFRVYMLFPSDTGDKISEIRIEKDE